MQHARAVLNDGALPMVGHEGAFLLAQLRLLLGSRTSRGVVFLEQLRSGARRVRLVDHLLGLRPYLMKRGYRLRWLLRCHHAALRRLRAR